MSLVKHKGSPYWYAQFVVNGKSHFKSTKTGNKALAKRIEQAHRDAVVARLSLGEDAKPITIKSAFTAFLKAREGTPSHKGYVHKVNVLLGLKMNKRTRKHEKVFGLEPDRDLHTLTSADLTKLVENRKLEGVLTSTIQHQVNIVRGTIDQHRKLGFLVPMSIEYPTLKQERKEIVYLTADEEARLLNELAVDRKTHSRTKAKNHSQTRLDQFQDQQDFVTLLLDLGCRTQEVACLEWDNVNVEAKTIQYRAFKTQKTQTKDMTDRVCEIIQRRLIARPDGQKYVFTDPTGESHRNYNIAWLLRAARRAGIEKNIGFHSMRRTYASKLVQAGVPLADIQSLLDHSSIRTTEIYAALAPTKASTNAMNVLNRINER